MKRKGFTLMELLAVLTVLAIISLITIPIVANVVSSSREKAYVNSIQAYGKAVENAMAAKRAEKGTTADTIQELAGYIEISGNEVLCNGAIENTDDGIVLTGCKVLDSNGEQRSKNTYRYNKGKIEKEEEDENYAAMITAYGKIVDGAALAYSSKYGNNPQTINELSDTSLFAYTGEVNGDMVRCDNDIQYEENSIKLTNCIVVNKEGQQVSKNKYTFINGVVESDSSNNKNNGSTSTKTTTTNKVMNYEIKENPGPYDVGYKHTLSGDEYYVIASTDDFVTLIKAEPLTVDEVNFYGEAGNRQNNCINNFTYDSVGIAHDNNGYGEVSYYSSSSCGYVKGSFVSSGCSRENISSYIESDIRKIVDRWAKNKFTNGELTYDNNKFQARLLTLDELKKLGYVRDQATYGWIPGVKTPSWLWNNKYVYWTMSADFKYVYIVDNDGFTDSISPHYYKAIRPVINVYKSKL